MAHRSSLAWNMHLGGIPTACTLRGDLMNDLTVSKIRELEEHFEGYLEFPFVFKLVVRQYNYVDKECRYRSCRISISDGGVQYMVDRWTVPSVKGSRLLVFNRIEDVRRFNAEYGNSEDILFLAESIDPQPVQIIMRNGCNFEDWWRLWNQFMLNPSIDPFSEDPWTPRKYPAPEGTFGVRALKLVTQVYDWRH